MINNYDSVETCFTACTTNSKKRETTSYTVKRRTLFSLMTVFLTLFSFLVQAQTTLISPTGDGGFENGATFAANGWSVANSANNPWIVGPLSNGLITGNAAFISSNGTTPSYNVTNTTSNYFWRDITVPAGEGVIQLSFNWIANGESTWDLWQVFVAPTSVTPVGGAHPGSGATNVPAAIAGATWVANGNLQTTVQTSTVFLPASLAGTTFRLIFHWKSDTSGGTAPPAQIDNISLTSRAAGTFISVTDGNWGDPATWDANAVPTIADNAIVAAHTVTINAVGQAINDLTVQGSLEFGVTPTTFNVNGNLNVEAGGEFLVFNGTTGKTLVVSGNIVNDGNIDISIGATTTGNLTLNGSAVQSISGSGTFANNLIRNLIFSNTSVAIPNINWDFDDVSVEYNLNITNAKINLNNNKINYGVSVTSAGNTFTITNGGFLNGTFSRWWTAGGTGYTTSGPTTIPTGAAGRYPFYSPTGEQRIFYLGRTTPTVGGKYAVTYNNATTNTTGLSIVDGAYTINNRWDGNFVVTLDGTTPVAASNWLTLFTPNAFITTATGARVLGQNAPLSGTHVNTSNAPYGQRSGVSTADLISGTGLYLGVNAADVPFVSANSGDWNVGSTWNTGTVPTCTDVVFIANGHTVTSTTSGNVVRNLTISSGGTLVVSAGDLTVGCTLNNNTLANNGTLTVSGGLLAVNGNMVHNAASTFNQSGGDILVDGNDGANVATSVASGTAIVQLNSQFINWTGGVLTILDPHANTTASNTLAYSNSTAHVNVSNAHTLKLGDGVSTDAGGNATNGFRLNTWVGSNRILFGNLEVNTLGGTNRHVTTTYSLGFSGNMTIEPSSEVLFATSYVAGNIVNNGTFTSTTSLFLANYLNGAETATTNAQTIGGTGVYRNLAAAPTANLTSLTVNNTNATGVTLNIPLSVSGTLTMTSGIINTTNVNLLTLGTATAGGTLAGTPSDTNMVRGPFARTIANANANTNFILFPVGKVAYAPIWAAPATTVATVMKAETFDTNIGTQSAAIVNMTTNRRWELPLVSGTISDINVRLGDVGILATSIPVQAPSASGEYTSTFGSVATAVAGVSTQSTTPVLSANYTGFLSYADSNACVGAPAPGNTIASGNAICLGTTVNLSLQNLTAGSGVSYQWFSSPDDVTYTPIATATNPTYSLIPTEPTYFMCEVTCATGPSTTASTPVYITFANEVTATVPGARCGTGTVDLEATPSAGATIDWYANATGGTSLATGTTFTTPSITSTTTFYAVASTATAGSLVLGAGATNSSATAASFLPGFWGGTKTQYIIRASELIQAGLTAGPITNLGFEPTNSGQTYQGFYVQIGHTALTTAPLATFIPNTGLTFVYAGAEANDGFTPAAGIVNNLTFGTGTGTTSSFVWDGTSNIVVSISWSRVPAAATATATTMKVDNVGFVSSAYRQRDNLTPTDMLNETAVNTTSSNRPRFTINGQLICSSSRVPVVATVSSPPTLTLSGATATICAGDATSTVTLTAGGSDYDTFVWSPLTGVTGDEITGWTFDPTSTTTYTLTASQTSGALCVTETTFEVVVNSTPIAMSITPASPTICVDAIQALTVTGGTIGASGSTTIGNDATVTVQNGIEPTAFNNRYEHYWMQMVFTAAELNASGIQAGSINGIKFNITTIGSAPNVTDYRVHMGNTALSTLTGFVNTGLSEVFAAATYTQQLGVNTITFDTPYVWDGVSNIILDVRNTGVDLTNNSSTYYTATADNKTVSAVTSTTFASSNAFAASNPTGTLSLKRLNTTFDWSSSEPTTVTWSPLTDLYTDAGATIPYAGANATTVYVKSSTVGMQSYTATSTAATTCFNTASVDVTVSALPDTTISRTDDTLTVAEAGATYQWVTCDGGGIFTPIGGETNQSYLVTAIGSYAVEVTKNGCMERSACFDVTTLGANSFDLNALQVYPNPVVNTLSIRYNEEITAISVYDLSGRLVKQITPNQTEVEVNMSELAAAMYIVKVNAGGNQTEFKVIKK